MADDETPQLEVAAVEEHAAAGSTQHTDTIEPSSVEHAEKPAEQAQAGAEHDEEEGDVSAQLGPGAQPLIGAGEQPEEKAAVQAEQEEPSRSYADVAKAEAVQEESELAPQAAAAAPEPEPSQAPPAQEEPQTKPAKTTTTTLHKQGAPSVAEAASLFGPGDDTFNLSAFDEPPATAPAAGVFSSQHDEAQDAFASMPSFDIGGLSSLNPIPQSAPAGSTFQPNSQQAQQDPPASASAIVTESLFPPEQELVPQSGTTIKSAVPSPTNLFADSTYSDLDWLGSASAAGGAPAAASLQQEQEQQDQGAYDYTGYDQQQQQLGNDAGEEEAYAAQGYYDENGQWIPTEEGQGQEQLAYDGQYAAGQEDAYAGQNGYAHDLQQQGYDAYYGQQGQAGYDYSAGQQQPEQYQYDAQQLQQQPNPDGGYDYFSQPGEQAYSYNQQYQDPQGAYEQAAGQQQQKYNPYDPNYAYQQQQIDQTQAEPQQQQYDPYAPPGQADSSYYDQYAGQQQQPEGVAASDPAYAAAPYDPYAPTQQQTMDASAAPYQPQSYGLEQSQDPYSQATQASTDPYAPNPYASQPQNLPQSINGPIAAATAAMPASTSAAATPPPPSGPPRGPPRRAGTANGKRGADKSRSASAAALPPEPEQATIAEQQEPRQALDYEYGQQQGGHAYEGSYDALQAHGDGQDQQNAGDGAAAYGAEGAYYNGYEAEQQAHSGYDEAYDPEGGQSWNNLDDGQGEADYADGQAASAADQQQCEVLQPPAVEVEPPAEDIMNGHVQGMDGATEAFQGLNLSSDGQQASEEADLSGEYGLGPDSYNVQRKSSLVSSLEASAEEQDSGADSVQHAGLLAEAGQNESWSNDPHSPSVQSSGYAPQSYADQADQGGIPSDFPSHAPTSVDGFAAPAMSQSASYDPYNPYGASQQQHLSAQQEDIYNPYAPPKHSGADSSPSRSRDFSASNMDGSDSTYDPYAPSNQSMGQDAGFVSNVNEGSHFGQAEYGSSPYHPNSQSHSYAPSDAHTMGSETGNYPAYKPNGVAGNQSYARSMTASSDSHHFGGHAQGPDVLEERRRARIPLAAFSIDGRMVTYFPGKSLGNSSSYAAAYDGGLGSQHQIQVRSLSTHLPSSSYASLFDPLEFCGPAFDGSGPASALSRATGGNSTTKAKKSTLIKYLQAKVDSASLGIGYLKQAGGRDDAAASESEHAEDQILLLRLLILLLEHDGGTTNMWVLERSLTPHATD